MSLFAHRHYNPWSGFGNDMHMMRRMLDMTDTHNRSTDTVEPSYRYEADETAGHFEIEMPGVSKENLSIEVHDNKLCVRGKRFRKQLTPAMDDAMQDAGQNGSPKEKKEEEVPSIVYLLEARLPQGADIDGIKADSVGDGILRMSVPMKKEKGPRRIEIGF